MSDRVALVTGGTRGIGLAMVKALRLAGIKVAIIGKSDNKPECDLYIKADLRQPLFKMDFIIDTMGGLDILVNNAGAQHFSPALDYLTDRFNEAHELMVVSPFRLSKQAAEYMLSHGGGHIVNILSTAAFQGSRNCVGYVAAKHALLGLMRALSIEWAPLIHVNAIAPGLIDTDMNANMMPERRALLESITPAGRFGMPEEVADALMYLINSTYVYGTTITVDGGWNCKNNG